MITCDFVIAEFFDNPLFVFYGILYFSCIFCFHGSKHEVDKCIQALRDTRHVEQNADFNGFINRRNVKE